MDAITRLLFKISMSTTWSAVMAFPKVTQMILSLNTIINLIALEKKWLRNVQYNGNIMSSKL